MNGRMSGWTARILLACGLVGMGFLAGYYIKGLDHAQSKPMTPTHHMVDESGNDSCKIISPQDALKVVEDQLRHPTIPIIKKRLPVVNSIEIVGKPQEGPWYYRVFAYVNGDERYLWHFEVDHMYGYIGYVWPTEGVLPKSKAQDMVMKAFEEKSHPNLKTHGPPASATKQVYGVTFDANNRSEWDFYVRVEGQDGYWTFTIDQRGELGDVYRCVP